MKRRFWTPQELAARLIAVTDELAERAKGVES